MKIPDSQMVTIEEGAVRQVEELFTRLDAGRVFFVVDEPAYNFSGAGETLQDCLKNREIIRFSDFELNPKLEDVERGIVLFRQSAPDVIMALGGGSALDMAKLIGSCGVQKGDPLEYISRGQPLDQAGPPLIAIPTTAGTGSEATHFAVVYVDGKKFSHAHPSLLPDYAIIDPELTYSLPAGVTTAGGLDALCQATESIWAVGANGESVGFASEALQLVLKHLEKAVHNPDAESRRGMARAAHLSGKAINISKTTAPHAISYGITTRFGVPHGMAAAMTLPSFLAFNSEVDDSSCLDPQGPDSVKERMEFLLKLLGNVSVNQAQKRLRSLMKKIECPLRLSDVGIRHEDIDWLAEQVNIERLANNPRKITARQLHALLEEIL